MAWATDKIRFSVLLVAVFLCAATVQAQTTLRYKFSKGDKLNYVMEQKTTTTMNLAGMDIQTGLSQIMDYQLRVDSVDSAGKAKIVQRFPRWRLTLDTPLAKIEVDSDEAKSPDNPLAKLVTPMMKALKQAELSLTLDSRGELSNLKAPAALIKAGKVGNIPGVSEMLSEDGLQSMLAQNGLVLPKGPIDKGKSWDHTLNKKTRFGTMKLKTTGTYEGPESRDGKNLEKISFKVEMTIEPDAKAKTQVKLTVDEAKGTAYFDNTAGRLAELSSSQNMSMEISNLGLTMKIDSQTSVTLK